MDGEAYNTNMRKTDKKTRLFGNELRLFVDRLKSRFDVLEVILFGSAVHNPQRANDLDILIVMDYVKNYWDLKAEISRMRSDKVPMDVTIIDPDAFKRESAANPFFREEILKKMKVLFRSKKNGKRVSR